ncbi:MAG: SGNH/GDSL hydrolase family protein [Clostridia bacterium]|nr:SGNH/GDSL hydrolase family protein [Clostridia bacterium]
MKLSSKTLKRLFKGALHFKEERGYLTAFRYEKSQLDYMEDKSFDWGWRMRAKFTGCMRIEFKTNARSISFDYLASEIHERANTIDLCVNGTLVKVHKIGESKKGRVELSLDEGDKRVAIYMPCECELAIKNFTIDGNYSSVREKGKKLLILGDSITQGAGVSMVSYAYPNVLQRETGYNVIAQGIGGYRFEPKDLTTLDSFEPDKILVFLGTNYYDCYDYDYESATKEYFKRIKELYPNTPIYEVTPLWRNNDVDWDRFNWCIDTVKKACYENGITVIDGFDLVPNVDECFADGVHPNSIGAYLLGTRIANVIKK